MANRMCATLISPNGKVIDKAPADPYPTPDPYIRGLKRIDYYEENTMNIHEFSVEDNKIVSKTYDDLGANNNLKYPFLAFSDQHYFFVYEYQKWDKLFLLNKNQGHPIEHIYQLNRQVSRPQGGIDKEYPDFKVCFSEGVYYVMILDRQRLLVFKLVLPESNS
jgi:hypothetical protein